MTSGDNLHTADEIQWFKEIFDTYYDSIRSYAWYKTGNSELADDIVQEVFLKLWQIRHKTNPDTIKSLLYTIATNLIKSHYRHLSVVYRFEKKQKESDEKSGQMLADESIRTKEFQAELETTLAQMPESARITLMMNRLENLIYEEIAQRLGLSTKAVEKRMSIALKFLRENLKQDMTHRGKNKTETDIPALTRQMLNSLRIPASTRSKKEAWDLLVQKIERQKAAEPVKSLSLVWKAAAIAASLLLVISFAYFKYSTVNLTTIR